MCLGVPGRLIEVLDPDNYTMMVDIGGVKRSVNVCCIMDDVSRLSECVGEWVIIHVGFAMARIDEDEARETLQLLQKLGELNEFSEDASVRDVS